MDLVQGYFYDFKVRFTEEQTTAIICLFHFRFEQEMELAMVQIVVFYLLYLKPLQVSMQTQPQTYVQVH